MKEYGATGFPTVLFLDHQGKEVARMEGRTPAALEPLVLALAGLDMAPEGHLRNLLETHEGFPWRWFAGNIDETMHADSRTRLRERLLAIGAQLDVSWRTARRAEAETTRQEALAFSDTFGFYEDWTAEPSQDLDVSEFEAWLDERWAGLSSQETAHRDQARRELTDFDSALRWLMCLLEHRGGGR